MRLIATDSPVCGSIASKTYPKNGIKEPLNTETRKQQSYGPVPICLLKKSAVRNEILTETSRAHQLLGLDVKVSSITAVLRQVIILALDGGRLVLHQNIFLDQVLIIVDLLH